MSNEAARSFLESVTGYAVDDDGQAPSQVRPVRLGIVDLAYDGTGNPRVKFDGESVMGVREYVALQPVAAGDRVVMLPTGSTFVVLGSVDGLDLGKIPGVLGVEHGGTGSPLPLPGPAYASGGAANSLTAGASTWQAIVGATLSLTPERDLEVDVSASAVCKASTGYTMIGVNVAGGLVVDPYDVPPGSPPALIGGAAWAPFTVSSVDTAIATPHKRLTLPAGLTTSFALWARRSIGSGTQTCNYPLLSVLPVRWA